jgi:type I restriction enzyme M protein
MKLCDLLGNAKAESCLAHFEIGTVHTVESMITEKNGKQFINCQICGKDVLAKPEEIVRHLWIHRLIKHYKYPISRLAIEYPVTFGRDSSKRADIVVFDADRPTVPYIIVEVKQATVKGGKDQLKSYTHATGAPLALWSDGDCRSCLEALNRFNGKPSGNRRLPKALKW